MNSRHDQIRQRIAHEAARLMVEHGIRDYHFAKRKAAERLRTNSRDLPRNDEIERERDAHQRLFGDDEQACLLSQLRKRALDAMRLLDPFRPRLVGPVLSGGAVDRHSEICLHLFSDPPEDVAVFLIESRIVHDQGEARVRFRANEYARLPAFRFITGGSPVELVVFSARIRRRIPLSPVDGRPMRRAKLAEVAALAETFT